MCNDCEKLKKENEKLKALAIGGEGEARFYYKDLAEDAVMRCADERSRAERAEAALLASEAREEPGLKLLKAAYHALRSYEFGNSDPTMARTVADQIDAEFKEAPHDT
jgi:hypothetical protein